MYNEDIHRWLDGTPCMPGGSKYTNWASGAPGGSNPQNGNENYMSIRMQDGGQAQLVRVGSTNISV